MQLFEISVENCKQKKQNTQKCNAKSNKTQERMSLTSTCFFFILPSSLLYRVKVKTKGWKDILKAFLQMPIQLERIY